MNHKSFVFFDCECANTFDGIGKICSLGYVLCDDELNVIESQDVVMNPECEFDWYLFSGKSEVKLAYSKDYFRTKPNFEAFYKDIKKLFTTGNRYITGFAVSNDVGFVNNGYSACDITQCDIWAIEIDTCYGFEQVDSFPSMEIANGIHFGSTEEDVIAAFGPCDDVYECEYYKTYEYCVDYTYYLNFTIYEEYGVTAIELEEY